MADVMRTRGGLLSIPLRGPLTLVCVLLVLATTVAAGWISYRAAYRSVEDEALASLAASAVSRDNSLALAITRKRERLQSALESVHLGCGISGVMISSCAREMLRPFMRAEEAYGASLRYGKRKPLRIGSFAGGGEISPGLPAAQYGSNNKAVFRIGHSDPESGLTLEMDFSVSGVVRTTDILRASTRVVTRIGANEFVVGEKGASEPAGPLVTSHLGDCLVGNQAWTLHNRQYIFYHPSRAMANTCVAALRDEQEILAPVTRLKSRIARVGIAFSVLALASAYLLAFWLARPVTRLRQRVRALRKGDYDSPVPVVGIGEVRELALAFSEMRDSVKQYRASLAENERRLALVYRAARLWVWEHDFATGRITWRGPADERDPEPMTFRNLLQRVYRDDRHALCGAVRKAKNTGAYDAEYRVLGPEGSIVWISSWGQVVKRPQRHQQLMIGVSLDVTARKNAEALVREKDKLEAAAELAGSLAHEINNPLTSILGAVYMLGRGPLPDPALMRYLTIAEQETQRVAQLVKQILSLYQPPATRAAIDMRSLLEDVVATCRAELKAKSQKIVLRPGYCGVVSGHREELVHAFANILRNSIESSPPDSEVHIRARLTHPFLKQAPWGVRILFADSGAGIPAAVLARVFEPFTGSKPEKGTGLGLWVARSTISKHGGKIRIRVARGRRHGTVVSVFLPAVRGPNGASSKPMNTVPGPSTLAHKKRDLKA
jgi:signal transduction histidine kinase/HAMP domain-containing protein